jgi:hypothetical protein
LVKKSCGANLRLKNDLLAMVKGEGEMSQHTLANERLVPQYSHGDANHLSNFLIKLRKANAPQKDRCHDL